LRNLYLFGAAGTWINVQVPFVIYAATPLLFIVPVTRSAPAQPSAGRL